MKEATGELNMTLVVIVAVAAIMGAAIWFVPKIIQSANEKFENVAEQNIPNHYVELVR